MFERPGTGRMSIAALASQVSYRASSSGASRALLAVREAGPAPAPPKPRLLDRVREYYDLGRGVGGIEHRVYAKDARAGLGRGRAVHRPEHCPQGRSRG